MTSFHLKRTILKQQADKRGEPFEITYDEFEQWEPGQQNAQKLLSRSGHRHVWRIDETLPWRIDNIRWSDDLRYLTPCGQGRPKGSRNKAPRRPRSAAKPFKPKRVLKMTEAQMLATAGRMQNHAIDGTFILTVSQWQSELQKHALE